VKNPAWLVRNAAAASVGDVSANGETMR